MTKTAAVVGGSLTGPFLALLLQKQGFEVSIFEAAPAAASRAGGVIGLDAESLGHLAQLGIGRDEVTRFPSDRIVRVDFADRREQGRVQRLYEGRTTSWTELHQLLVDRLPEGTMEFGRKVVGLEGDVLQFADGSTFRADLIAFADGRGSVGRKALQPERTISYAGLVAHRGRVAYEPEEIRDFIRYTPEHGNYLNVFPAVLQDGTTGLDWTFFTRASEEQFRSWFGGDPTKRLFVLPHQIRPEATAAVDETADEWFPKEVADVVHKTTERQAVPLLDIAPPTELVDGNAVLIGDALTPVYPHTGSGLNNGLKAAAEFAHALGEHAGDLGATMADRGWQDAALARASKSLQFGKTLIRQAGI